MNKAEYLKYLRSPAWLAKRDLVMEAAKGRCAICAAPAVDVHHRTYSRVGREKLEDLVALCGDCHAREHGKAPPTDWRMTRARRPWLERKRGRGW